MVTLSRKRVIFAPDLAARILLFLSPREIVRLRLVSQYFNGITRDRRLWGLLYATACLPRPSGPFQWQSTRFLECTLISSERTSLTWTLRPALNIVARIRGPRLASQGSSDIPPWRFLLNRLFIWCEETKILTHDLDTGTRILLWNNPTPIRYSSIEAVSLTHQDGERVYVAFLHPVEGRCPSSLIKLLEFPVQRDAIPLLGPVSFTVNLPLGTSFSMSASFPFLCFDNNLEHAFKQPLPLFFDTRTRATYTFPSYKSGLEGPVSVKPSYWMENFIGLSRTHILVTRELTLPNGPRMTHIQAYTLPPRRSTDNVNKLCLSHEVLTSRIPPPTHVLRDSVVDPITRNIHLRFLGRLSFDTSSVTRYSCIDMALALVSAPSLRQKTLPINVREQLLFCVQGQTRHLSLQGSNEGHARGLVASRFLYRFSIDASGARCTTVLSEPEVRYAADTLKGSQCIGFDGVRGRVCYDMEMRDVRHRDLVVAEFR